MKKQFISILAIVSFSASGYMTLAIAQERPALRDRLQDVRERVEVRKEAVRGAVTERKEALKATREEFQTKVEAAKEEFKIKREAQKAELKARLEKIKDKKKKQAIERLDNQFTEINTKLTNHWANQLNRLEGLLSKVSSRMDKAAANGRDVSAVMSAIESAKTVIANARAAVVVQLTKTYQITVTDEAGLRSGVAVARAALNNDLKALKEMVQAAHKAVVEATKTLGKIPRVNELKEPEATSTEASAELAPAQ